MSILSKKFVWGIFLIVVVAWLLLRDWNPGRRELEKSQLALLSVRSWHVKAVNATPGLDLQTEDDVSCPDFHSIITNTAVPENPSVQEVLFVGSTAFRKVNGSKWVSVPRRQVGRACSDGPLIETKPLIATIVEMQTEAHLKNVGTADSNGVSCRRWEISLLRGSMSRLPAGFICIDETSHLPLEIQNREGRVVYQFSNWNAPIKIEQPLDSEIVQ
jgi:hypothetical protein